MGYGDFSLHRHRQLDEASPRVADWYAELLAAHRVVVRAALSRHAGVEVGTQGYAFFAAFREAGATAAAATEIRDGLGDGPVRVRIGIYTGEPLVTDEGYVGLEVHRAARTPPLRSLCASTPVWSFYDVVRIVGFVSPLFWNSRRVWSPIRNRLAEQATGGGSSIAGAAVPSR